MGARMKKFRATPEQVAKCRRNMMGLHRDLLLTHVIGMGSVCLFAIGLAAYYMVMRP